MRKWPGQAEVWTGDPVVAIPEVLQSHRPQQTLGLGCASFKLFGDKDTIENTHA